MLRLGLGCGGGHGGVLFLRLKGWMVIESFAFKKEDKGKGKRKREKDRSTRKTYHYKSDVGHLFSRCLTFFLAERMAKVILRHE